MRKVFQSTIKISFTYPKSELIDASSSAWLLSDDVSILRSPGLGLLPNIPNKLYFSLTKIKPIDFRSTQKIELWNNARIWIKQDSWSLQKVLNEFSLRGKWVEQNRESAIFRFVCYRFHTPLCPSAVTRMRLLRSVIALFSWLDIWQLHFVIWNSSTNPKKFIVMDTLMFAFCLLDTGACLFLLVYFVSWSYIFFEYHI